jgi:Ca2+-binding EF-hand superfamily protein
VYSRVVLLCFLTRTSYVAFVDTDHSGAIDYDELLYGLRVRYKIPLTMFPHRVYSVYILTNPQGQLPPKLLVLVHQIFDLLDRQGVDAIDPTTLISHFDPSRHPEVQGRMKTAEQVQKEFLDTFDVGGVQAGLITREEFVRYYTNISAAINDDDYFEQILRAVWHIPAGVSNEALAGYQRQLIGNKEERNSLANKLRLAQNLDASVRRPSSASTTRRPSDPAVQAAPRFGQSSRPTGGNNGPSGFAPQAPPQAPVRPQSAGPMGRGRLNTHYIRQASPVPPAVGAEEVFEPVEALPSGDGEWYCSVSLFDGW